MIQEEELKAIGKFQKPHALKGELNVILDLDPEYIEEGFPLIVEIDGIYVPFFPDSVRPKGSQSYLIHLKGIDTAEEARAMVNKTIYAMRKDITDFYDADPDEILFDDDLVGYKVFNNDEEVGTVKYVDDSTINVILEVEKADGTLVYIPLVDDFIKEVNEEDKILVMELPDGLLDLNEADNDWSEDDEESEDNEDSEDKEE